jgi:hypothetical protein
VADTPAPEEVSLEHRQVTSNLSGSAGRPAAATRSPAGRRPPLPAHGGSATP